MKKKYLLSLLLILVLTSGFGYLYLVQHAWGTWGDDSAGYIYLWGRLNQNQPLVYQEELTVKALEFFGDEKLARWTTPTHHEIISPAGYLASIYPIGLSLLMYFPGLINDSYIYLVLPVVAVLNLILVYLISQFIFSRLNIKTPASQFLSFLASLSLGLSELYYNYAVAQPMREIPAIFFLLLGFLFLLVFLSFKRVGYFVLAVFFLSFSFNIRETSLIIALPAFLLLLSKKWSKKEWGKLILITLITFLIAASPSIYNSAQISKYKEKFRKKDISSIAITSNLDHLSSFSLQNVFDNQGKFRPGRGALPHYWQVIQEMSGALFWLCFVFIGLVYLFKKNKWLAASLMAWVLSFLALFSLWINPYSRYILPIFPILAILGSLGLYCFINNLLPQFFAKKRSLFIISSLTIVALMASFISGLKTIKENLNQQAYIFKAISHQDLDNLKSLSSGLQTLLKNQSSAIQWDDVQGPLTPPSGKKDLLVFSGDWQYGISETLEAHTGLQAIRFPLAQKKFVFDQAKIKDFFDQMMLDYNIYFWVDSTTEAQTNEFLRQYNLSPVYQYSFTFEPEVQIYAITK